MSKNYKVIFEDEDIIGRLSDIINVFEDNPGDEIVQEAIGEAKRLNDVDGDEHIYKCWYNPMGAYIFTMLVEKE